MFKNQTLDRFSRIGRLRQRLDEIVQAVAERKLPRVDGGDQIGQQIVAAVEALGQRSEEENRLLVAAHRERARLYHESSGATVLEAAESLIAAHAVLREIPERERETRELAATARAIMQALLEIGSRRNTWACLEILLDEAEISAAPANFEALLDDYVSVSRDLIVDGRDDGILVAVMRHCEWSRNRAPTAFRRLADLLPFIIEQGIETMPSGALLRAYLYARNLALRLAPELIEGVVRRLADRSRIDAEARIVYQDLLVTDPARRDALEGVFRDLAHVNPGIDLAYDADADSLNMLLADYFGDREWVWRNRAILMRRRGDAFGALAHLARAMSISGYPPEIMGILAPVVAGLGFVQSAHQFARFAGAALREQFHLDVLDLLDARPRSEIGRLRLQKHLERAGARPELPVEFRRLVRARSAELLFEAGAREEAKSAYTEIFAEDLTDETAAVRLAELALEEGAHRRVEGYIAARFSPRVKPFELDLRSRLAELDGDVHRASMLNAEAIAAMPAAQAAGRHEKDRSLALLADRIRALHGEAYVDCALLVMLQVETHAPPHADLLALENRLERRRFELDLKSSDHVTSVHAVTELARRDQADSAVFMTGIRASLASGDVERARELVELADREGHGSGSEIRLMRALILLQGDDPAAARDMLTALMAEQPTVETCRLLALAEIRLGDEEKAAAILAGAPEIAADDDQERYRCHHLRGLLLERLGRKAEAHEAHLAAVGLFADWNEARRRAGLLALDLAFDEAGELRDGVLAWKALDLLDGFHDGESVMRSAIARSRLEDDADRAVAELEAALRRVNGDWLRRLRRELLHRQLALGRTDEAAETADALLDSSEGEERALLGGVRAAALRRRALEGLARVTGRDSRVERAALEALAEADRLDGDGEASLLGVVLRHALGDGEDEPALGRNPDPALAVAVALAGGQRRKDGGLRRAVTRAVAECRPEVSLAARLVEALTAGTAKELLAVVDEIDEAALSLPWSRIDVLRVVAAKALGENDRVTLDAVLGRAPGRFADVSLYRELVAATEGDCSRVVTMVEDLRRVLGDRLQLPDERLRALRMRVTAMREEPSEAWASARLRVAGKRTRTWDASALEYWVGRMADDESGVALHHVALMELARAHELEAEQRCGLDAWRRVHDLWSRLLAHNRFWLELEWSNEEEVKEAVSAVREQLGGWLLLAQLRLAKRRLFAGNLAQAIEHARLVMASPLMRHCNVAAVRDALFDALAGDYDRQIQRKRYDEALAAIDHVIVADRDNPRARQEMVRTAGQALAPTLATLDALSSPADRSMLAETCEIISRVLVPAEESIRELAGGEVTDAELARALVTGLRALAFVARQRDDDVAQAAECLQLAVRAAESAGLPSSSLRRLHSDLGLESVRRTISETPTRPHEIAEQDQDQAFARALAEVDRLLEIDPDNVRVITQKARLLLASDRDEEAEKIARDLFARARESRETGCVRISVELLHQVQSERETLRYDSRMEMLERLMAQRNWRAALELFREAVVGRESEARHLLIQADILLGLRRFDKAEGAIAQLADCDGMDRAWRSRHARLQLLRMISDRGGDALSAFELVERGDYERAMTVVQDLLEIDDRDWMHNVIAALAQAGAGRSREAEDHARTAWRHGRGHDWLRVVLDELENAR